MHHQRQIEPSDVNQYPLDSIFSAPLVHALHPSSLISVGENTFQQLPAPAQQLPTNPPPIAINSFLGFHLAFPTTLPTIRLRDIRTSASAYVCNVSLL